MRTWFAVLAAALLASLVPISPARAQRIDQPRFALHAVQPTRLVYAAPGPLDPRCDRPLAGQLAIGAVLGAGAGWLGLYLFGRLWSDDPHIPADLRNRALLAGAAVGVVRTGWNWAAVCGTPVF